MTYSLIYSIVLGLLPCLIPPYALRLNRVFGTARIGWMLFAVFALLGLLQLLRSWHPNGMGIDPKLMVDLLYLLIPLLLLIGMVHIETLFKERLRVEQEEKRMRGELELQVRERTADLDATNEAMQREITLRRQGEAELKKSKEQYRFLFEDNPLPMWVFDLRSLRFLAFNNAAVRAFGYTVPQFRELSAAELYSPQEVNTFIAQCQAKPDPYSRWRQRHCRKDGSEFEVEVTAQDLVYAECPARLVLAYPVSPTPPRPVPQPAAPFSHI